MKFIINRSAYNAGTEKSIPVSNGRYLNGKTYYITRSQVTVVDQHEDKLLIDVKDWVINANQVPIFDLNEMQLDRGNWEVIKEDKKTHVDIIAILTEQMNNAEDPETKEAFAKAIKAMS